VKLLGRVAAALEAAGIDCALIGAMALAARGVARATFDIDLLTLEERALDESTWSALRDAGLEVEIRHGDASDPLAGVVRVRARNEPMVDVIVGRSPWQRLVIEGAELLPIGGVELPVVRPAHLVLLKLFAGGPSDRWDIEQLLAEPGREELVAEVEARLPDLPADCRALWQELRGLDRRREEPK
jgi:hypothetical protein